MAKLRPRLRVTSEISLVEPAEPMRAHEGSRPDPADAAAYAEWLRVRHARWSREAGEPLDPRHALLMGLQ